MSLRNAAAAGKRVLDVNIIGAIGWDVTVQEFIQHVKSFGEVDEIHLDITSEGGLVFDGLAIIHYLASHKARKTARVNGLAASMASCIACACDEVSIPANAFFMIHNPSGGAWGEAGDLRKAAELLEQIKPALAKTYERGGRCKWSTEEIVQKMDEETWLTGAEAVEAGLCDVLLPAVAIAAMDVRVDGFAKVPAALTACLGAVGEDGPKGPEGQPGEADAELRIPVRIDTFITAKSPTAEAETKKGFFAQMLDRVMGRKHADAPEAAPQDVQTLRAELQAAHARVDALQSVVGERDRWQNEATKLRADLQSANARVAEMETQAKTVLDHLDEIGFAPREAMELPTPVSDATPDADTDEAKLERWRAMEDGEKKQAFFAEHKEALWRANKKT